MVEVMSRFGFNQDENGPFINFSINGGEIMRIDWETSMLFTHSNMDYVDHLFVQTDPTEEQARTIGAFIWRQLLPDFDDLVNGLIVHDFPHLHLPYPNEHDLASYEQSGLTPPEETPPTPKIIEEDDDERVAQEAVAHIDEEWSYFDEEWHDGEL